MNGRHPAKLELLARGWAQIYGHGIGDPGVAVHEYSEWIKNGRKILLHVEYDVAGKRHGPARAFYEGDSKGGPLDDVLTEADVFADTGQ